MTRRLGLPKISAFVLGSLVASCLEAAELKGRVVENELSGRPMANVQIGAAGANPVTTDSLGFYRLVFPKKAPGDLVSLSISIAGYEVVNEVQLRWNLPQRVDDHPLDLLLCKPAGCEEMRRRFYRLKGIEAVELRYRQEVEDLKRRNQATEVLLARLRKERDEALASAEKAAEDLARIRPSEASELYQRALRLFVDGQIEAAIKLLDEAKLERALAAARRRREEADREIRQVLNSYLLKGILLAFQFRFDEAEKAYKAAVAVDPESFDALSALALFYQTQNRYAPAREIYSRCLNLARRIGSREDLALTQNNLGVLLKDEDRMEEARQLYEEALASYRDLAVANPEKYRPNVATLLNNLGSLLGDEGRMEEARRAYEEALAIRRDLALANPDVYNPDLAETLNHLGIFFRAENRIKESHRAYAAALAIRRELVLKNAKVYRSGLALTLNNFGSLLSDEGRVSDARRAYEEALTIFRDLASTNPEAYRSHVAATLSNLGILLRSEGRIEECRRAHEEALAIRRELASTNPEVYNPDLAATLINLGTLLEFEGRSEEARQAHEEALSIYRALASANPEVYSAHVAIALHNLGLVLIDMNRPEKLHQSLGVCEESLEIRRSLAKRNPNQFLPDVAASLSCLALVHASERQMEEARELLVEAIGILEPFAARETDKFRGKLEAMKRFLDLLVQ